MTRPNVPYIIRNGLAQSTLSPHYDQLPRDREENAAYRLWVSEEGGKSTAKANRIKKMCAEDILYHVNSFCYVFRPHDVDNKIQPFNTWDYQDETILTMCDAIRSPHKVDLCVKKSRMMAFSWVSMVVLAHFCEFSYDMVFALVSRDKSLVENMDNPDTLLWKFEFLLGKAPGYTSLRPSWFKVDMVRKVSQMTRKFSRTRSVAVGCTTTEDLNRGGRPLAAIIDEADFLNGGGHSMNAGTSLACKTRILGSTLSGQEDTWFKNYDHHKTAVRVTWDWKINPEFSAGLYKAEDGLRSPWFDEVWDQINNPVIAMRELRMDTSGGDSPAIPLHIIEWAEANTALPPFTTGALIHDERHGEPIEFAENSDGAGELRLWCDLTDGSPPDGFYAIGADVATGSTVLDKRGQSASVLSVANVETGVKVAEFVSGRIHPNELAMLAMSMGRWFSSPLGGEAVVVWESQGPGSQFGSILINMGYSNMFERPAVNSKGSVSKRNGRRLYGFHQNPEAKKLLVGNYSHMIQLRTYTERSGRALSEAKKYVNVAPSGNVEHKGTLNTLDPTQVAKNHGDAAMASMLSAWVVKDYCMAPSSARVVSDRPPRIIPMNCLAYRIQESEREAAQSETW